MDMHQWLWICNKRKRHDKTKGLKGLKGHEYTLSEMKINMR